MWRALATVVFGVAVAAAFWGPLAPVMAEVKVIPSGPQGTGGVSGSGSANSLTKWSGASSLTTADASDDGTTIDLASRFTVKRVAPGGSLGGFINSSGAFGSGVSGYGADFQFTTAGTTGTGQHGLRVDLIAGYTGSAGLIAINSQCRPASTGSCTGVNAEASGGATRAGLYGIASGAGTNGRGVIGQASGSTNNVSGLFFSGTGSVPSYTGTTPLLVDNADVAASIAVFRDNGTPAVQFLDGGDLDAIQHIRASGSAPTLSSCGTSPSITGSDVAGKVTAGTGGTLQSCTLTFATAYATAPSCFVNDETEILILRAVTTTTTLVIDCAVAGCLASDVVSYLCVAGS